MPWPRRAFAGCWPSAARRWAKALILRRKLLGEEHPDLAGSYSYVAYCQQEQGQYAKAEEGHARALAIRRKVLGEEHPHTATSYNNLAANQQYQGKYAQAEEGLRKALAIRRKVLGEEHPGTATCYNNVAFNLNAQGKYAQAEEGLRQALAIQRKVLGEEHPATAATYHNLAGNLYAQGKYAQAEEGLRKALAIRRKVLGEEHPDTAACYNSVALNLNAQGQYAQAEALWLHAADAFTRARLQITVGGLERAAFSSERSPLSALAAVLARNGKAEQAWQRYEESLSRGAWDDLSAQLRRPQVERDRLNQLAARIEQLNKRIEQVSGPRSPAEQKRQHDELLSQMRQAYEDLAAFTQQLEKQYGPIAGQVFDQKRIQAALPADAALLAWLDLPGQPRAADPGGEHWAILLRSGGAPVWIRLAGTGKKGAWTDADTQLPIKLRTALQAADRDWQPLAQALRRQRLQPLIPQLEGVRHLIVLPSTALAGVPVEIIAEGYIVSYAPSGTLCAHLHQLSRPGSQGLLALADPLFDPPTPQEKPLPLPPGGVLLTLVSPGSNAAQAGLRANDVLLRYGDTDLSGPADLARALQTSVDSEKRIAVVLWRDGHKLPGLREVRAGKLGVLVAQEPAPKALAEQRRLEHWLAQRGGEEGQWQRLPGTRFEVAAVQELFGTEAARVLLDSEASEQRLTDLARSGALSRYRYVHLATHGEVNDAFPLRSAMILARDQLPDDKQRTQLLLSGQPIPDGRLSAEEVLQQWHLDSELVTLSACQSALGKYERSEGFVGFAQALILAGSRSVCLSLWKVDDTATALLMERFYQNLLGKRPGLKAPMGKAQALAEAKRWLRQLSRAEALAKMAQLSGGVVRGKGYKLHPLPEEATSKDGKDQPFAHPYYWAAFVLQGQAD
jgi:Tfp pilus assembly protein PilF